MQALTLHFSSSTITHNAMADPENSILELEDQYDEEERAVAAVLKVICEKKEHAAKA
jgi:hypothetical protein